MKTKKEIIDGATLYLADCRDVLPTLAPVDMIFTDPPYGHNNNNNGDLIERWEAALGRGARGAARPIANDGAADVAELIPWLYAQAARLLRPGGCCCCCGGGGGPDPQSARWSLWLDGAMDFKQMIVWDKGPMGMGWHYRRSYETILVGTKPGAACKWHVSEPIENVIRPGMYGIRKITPQADDHPTPKPPQLAGLFIRCHSLPGEVVLDPFMGAGSTGVAAIGLGRKFIGVEIEPKYFDIACKQIEKEHTRPNLLREEPRKFRQAPLDGTTSGKKDAREHKP